MNKKNFSLIFFTIICLAAQAQTIINEGVLKYTETTTLINKSGKEIKRTQAYSISFSNDYLKGITQRTTPVKSISTSISDLTKQTTFLYLTNKEKYYMFEDKFDPNIFSVGLYAENTPSIKYLNDTLTLNNLLCKKAFYSFNINGDTKEMEVWYCPDYKIDPSEKTNYIFKDLNGLPVQFSFEQQLAMSFSAMGMTNPHVSFVLDSFYTTKDNNIGLVDEIEKYVPVAENEKMGKMIEIISPSGKTILNNATVDSLLKTGTTTTKIFSGSDRMSLTISSHSPFKVNDTLKNFKAVDLNGNEKTLNSYAGKIIVLNFWFNRCPPCIAEMPMLNKTQAMFDDKKVAFVSMTFNTKEEVETFLKTNKFDFEKLVDAQDMVVMYGTFVYPTTLVIDANHIIRFLKIDNFENEDELKNEINKLL